MERYVAEVREYLSLGPQRPKTLAGETCHWNFVLSWMRSGSHARVFSYRGDDLTIRVLQDGSQFKYGSM